MGFRAWSAEIGADWCAIVVSSLMEKPDEPDRLLQVYRIDWAVPQVYRIAWAEPGVAGWFARVPNEWPNGGEDGAMLQEAARDRVVDDFRNSGDEARRTGLVRYSDGPTDAQLLRWLALTDRRNALSQIHDMTSDEGLQRALNDALEWGPLELKRIPGKA